MSTERPPNLRPSRRWFQFSMRTLLLLLLVSGLLLSWVVYEREQTRKRAEAVSVISKAGGWVSDNDESTSWLSQIRAFLGGDSDGPFIAVCLSKARFTNVDLARLEALNNLRWLELDQTQISDAGLPHLEGFSQLHYLDVSGTQVTELGLQKLRNVLPNITIIR